MASQGRAGATASHHELLQRAINGYESIPERHSRSERVEATNVSTAMRSTMTLDEELRGKILHLLRVNGSLNARIYEVTN